MSRCLVADAACFECGLLDEMRRVNGPFGWISCLSRVRGSFAISRKLTGVCLSFLKPRTATEWPLVHRLAVRVNREAATLQGDLGPAVLKIRRRIVELKRRGALPG